MKKISILILLCVSLLSSIALATSPSVPNAFYGKAEYRNGNPIPDNYVVTAGINGIITASCNVNDGKYGYNSDTCIVLDYYGSGGTVKFYINGEKADQEIEFESMSVTELDLTAGNPPSDFTGCGDNVCDVDADECLTCPVDCNILKTNVCCGDDTCSIELDEDDYTCPEDCEEETTTSSSGGGGGGGGGGSSSSDSSESTQTTSTCTEKWICGLWTECIDGKQIRYCEDLNKCATTQNVPEQSRTCEIQTTKPEPTSPGITGAVIGARTLSLIGIYVIAILAALLAVAYFRARMGKVKRKVRKR